MSSLRYFGALATGAALLPGCAVYVPTVPSTPLVKQPGAVEVTAALRGFTSLEAGAAWSPAPHLLLAGEAALQATSDHEMANGVTTDYPSRHWQGGVGLGTYRLLGPKQRTYLGAMAGVGLAKADVYDVTAHIFTSILPIFGSAAPVHYQATYLRYYGQVYVARLTSANLSYGFSLRTTAVNYRELLRDGQPIGPPARLFFEPHAFVRVGGGAIQGLSTVGYSFPTHHDPQSAENQNLAPGTWLFSLGIVVRPHFKRPQD